MTTSSEQNFKGWNALTSDIAHTKNHSDMTSLEIAYRNTPITLSDFAELIVANEVIVIDTEDTSILGIFGSKGFGPWS
jgi:hypothetical protein